MSEGEAPAVAADPVTDADRKAALRRLHDLVATDDLRVERFSAAVDQVLSASAYTELEAVMAPLPPLVRVTPAARRLARPLEIDAGMGRLDLGGGWQLAAETCVRTLTGRCRLDLTEASWDAIDVDLRLHTEMGLIDVIVPDGVAVHVVTAKGGVKVRRLAPAVPGGPRLTVEASARSGEIRIGNAEAPRWSRLVRALRRRPSTG